ncbi:MAG TPA: aldo/keto reductase [Gammaproteobacteria bacterium]|nr:aldo/keto reductase [Gammaproteobacteria bacterium]
MDGIRIDRRQILALAGALGVAGTSSVMAQAAMPRRAIPGTGESLPVIGLGSSKVVQEIAVNGPAPLAAVLRELVANGGAVVDTWPRNAANDAAFGEVINASDLRGALFVTTKIDQTGREAGIAQLEAALENYGRDPIDLAQIFSLTDVDTHWPSLRSFKDSGRARYIGVTVAEAGLYDALEAFLARETPDFVQINYSITERESESRFLPMLADRGIGVIVNRPFMNGAYFDRLENESLPAWTEAFDCASWAQFSLKYILANPHLTCVLTETSDPEHMRENAQAALGPLPDEAARRRMRDFIDAL